MSSQGKWRYSSDMLVYSRSIVLKMKLLLDRNKKSILMHSWKMMFCSWVNKKYSDVFWCILMYSVPYILYPIPHTLYPIPYTLYSIPYTLYPIPAGGNTYTVESAKKMKLTSVRVWVCLCVMGFFFLDRHFLPKLFLRYFLGGFSVWIGGQFFFGGWGVPFIDFVLLVESYPASMSPPRGAP